jgi:SUKH-3 immunity protein
MEHGQPDRRRDSLVRAALVEAGWREGRAVDVAAWVSALTAVGYTIDESAIDVWREFGGLTIHSHATRSPSSSLRVDPVDACIDSLDEAHRLAGHYEIEFSPLGMWSVQFRTYIANKGKVIAVGPGVLWRLGNNFPEALDYVVNGDGGPSRAQKVTWLAKP